MKPIFRQLGLDCPILLAPMAGVSGGALAGAVSRAGGFGFIGGGYCDEAWIANELRIAGKTPIGVGFITWALQRKPELLAKVLEYEPRAIMLSFGDISPFTDTIHKAGVPLFSQVQSVRGAREAVQKGADVIVAQGGEAGGHGAARGTFALIPSIRDAIGDTPLVAAGGIADGRGIAAALLLGADAVLCGTAFYVADESLANVKAKAVAVATTGDDTVRSTVFDRARGLNWPTPWTLRARNNAFHQKWQSSPDSITQVQCQSYAMASAAGDMETMAVIVGEAVDLVRTISPASMIISKMAYDAEKLLTAAPARSIFQMKDHVND